MSGEQVNCHLLAGEKYQSEARNEQIPAADEGVELGNCISSVTGVLLFSTFVALCGAHNFGLAVGYSSPVESGLIDDLGLSTKEYSFFGSILTIGGALGSVACGKMSEYYGRKGAFAVASVLSIAGWLTIAVSQGVLLIDLGRLLLGFATGLCSYLVPVYLAEVTPKDIRGGFVVLNMLMIYAGISTAYILGIFVSWRVLAAIGIIPSLIQLIGLFFIPESPRWLFEVKQEKFEAALQRLRGTGANTFVEAAEIKEYLQASEQTSQVSTFQLFDKKYAYVSTIGIGLMGLSRLGGLNEIVFYGTSIIESAGFSRKLGTIMLAVLQMPSVSLSVILTDKCGRRYLLMVSASGVCLACTLVGFSFLIQDYAWIKGFSPYVTLTGVLMYSVFFAIGLGGIPYLIIAEIFPLSIKGSAGSMAILAGWLANGFVAFVFNVTTEWSYAGTFFILAAICGLTLLFVVKLVPETKGKTLEEIQASLNQKFPSHENLT